MQRLLDLADRATALPRRHPMAWPLLMVLLAVSALAASLILQPGTDELTYLGTTRVGGECGFLEATGKACPSCGMTRSWLWLARGDLLTSLRYNAAGALLFLGLIYMGVVGAIRLVTRDPDRLRMPMSVLSGLVMAWMLGPYLSLWFARMLGYYPLS